MSLISGNGPQGRVFLRKKQIPQKRPIITPDAVFAFFGKLIRIQNQKNYFGLKLFSLNLSQIVIINFSKKV